VLDALAGSGVEVDYLYTDLSQFFLNAARERFAAYPWIRYAEFDLDRDFRAQGLTPNSFDVILAGDVLHATRDVGAVLARLRELAVAGGWLVFQEMTRDHYQIMTSLELMVRLDDSGDFSDVRGGHAQTFLAAPQWHALLAEAGAELVLDLPAGDPVLEEVGMRVFGARMKADRHRVDPADLTAFAAGRLPEYMLPATIQVVDGLPLSANGKVDRATLASWLVQRAATTAGGAEAAGELEQRVAAIWADVLKVERVGRDQNFYELGGDSLLAAQLTGRLVEDVPEAAGLFFDQLLREVLERPTVAELAATLVAGAAAAGAGQDAVATAEAGRTLVPLGGVEDGPVQVLFHDGGGELTAYEALAPESGKYGPVLGVAGWDGLATADVEPAALIERLAERYVQRLREEGYADDLDLYGHDAGGVLAVEVARQLAELGIEARGVTVSGSALADGPLREAAGLVDGVYAGDVTVVVAADSDPVGFWADRCLGEVTPVELADCLDPANAGALAAIITAAGAMGGLR
jgi:pyochelin synthetase